MFTGLIEATVVVQRVEGPRGAHSDRPLRLEVENPWAAGAEASPELADAAAKGAPALGESVAVDGVCLTVVAPQAGAKKVLAFDVAHETLLRTTLGELQVGQRVHLERALAFGDRLGGHLVAGHVDARGTVGARQQEGSSLYLGIDVAQDVLALSAAQGSVTLAGVSLTIARIDGARLWVCLIPHTLAVTHLGALQVGAKINCEADLLARYLQRLVQQHPLGGAQPQAPTFQPEASRAL